MNFTKLEIQDQIVSLTLLNKIKLSLKNISLLVILQQYNIEGPETFFGNLFDENAKINEITISNEINSSIKQYKITFGLEQLKDNDLYVDRLGNFHFNSCENTILNSSKDDLFELVITITHKDQLFIFKKIFKGSEKICVHDFFICKPTVSIMYIYYIFIGECEKITFMRDKKITENDPGYGDYTFEKIINVLKYSDDTCTLSGIAHMKEHNDWWGTIEYFKI